MRSNLKIALLLGVVTFVSGAGTAPAIKTADGPMQGLERSTERGADRLLREFDLNKDGRVTHDEMNRTIGARFVMATHHAPTMTMDQFMVVRANAFRQANDAMFRRLDWNTDGKLSLAEFAARNASGSCRSIVMALARSPAWPGERTGSAAGQAWPASVPITTSISTDG